MTIAYNKTLLKNLLVSKETRDWVKQGWLNDEQHTAIQSAFPTSLYHPNVLIRILLFIATLIALSGVTGMLALFVNTASDNTIFVMMSLYGIASFFVLDQFFISAKLHYKSGVNEALLYHSIGWTLGGVIALTDGHPKTIAVVSLVVFGFAAFRYLDLISTLCAFISFGMFVFLVFYDLGGLFQQIIPFIFLGVFTPMYLFIRKTRKRSALELWCDVLIVLESLSLLTIYAAGNYLVVRELSVELLDMSIEPGQDIPFAWLFYLQTILIPAAYCYIGIKQKDVVILRTSLFAAAFSVFTFKYYYSTGHHEITFTVGGALLILISLVIFRYLRMPRNGFTRDNIFKEKWAEANPQAFIVSQTLGGNQNVPGETFEGRAGEFGGGGASGSF